DRARLVRQFGDGGNVKDLQKRIRGRLDPDQLRGRRDDRTEAGRTWVFGIASSQAPLLEDAFEEPIRAAVQIGRRSHFSAGLEDGEARGRCRQSRGERQAALAAFERGQASFQGGPRRVAATRILVSFVLAGRFLGIRGGCVDRNNGGPGGRISVLASVNGERGEALLGQVPRHL